MVLQIGLCAPIKFSKCNSDKSKSSNGDFSSMGLAMIVGNTCTRLKGLEDVASKKNIDGTPFVYNEDDDSQEPDDYFTFAILLIVLTNGAIMALLLLSAETVYFAKCR